MPESNEVLMVRAAGPAAAESGVVTAPAAAPVGARELPLPLPADERAYFQQAYGFVALLHEKGTGRAAKNRPFPGRLPEKVYSPTQLNARIKAELAGFHRRVTAARREGRAFIIEELAERLGLTEFEKTVLLWFIHSELERSDDEPFVTDLAVLMELFDLENNRLERLARFGLFTPDRPLVKHGLLQLLDRRNSPYRCRLAPAFFAWLGAAQAGDAKPWAGAATEPDNEESERPSASVVGALVEPKTGLDQVKLPAADLDQVRFFIAVHRDPRFAGTGVLETIRHSAGLSFLFTGPPGTGKSMLAEAIARELGKKLLVVESARIFSRYVGDTDKRISAMFREAQEQDAVLLIDEADSFLYSRSIADQDHEIRFVNDMLNGLEHFPGVVILTTNMAKLIDPAVERRIALKLEFGVPDAAARATIWQSHLPPQAAPETAVDYDRLARAYPFAGGNIRNAVVNALRLMVRDGRARLTAADLVAGAELEKSGMRALREGRIQVTGFGPAPREAERK